MPDHVHGTAHGYRCHRKNGTPPCTPCTEAIRETRKRDRDATQARRREPLELPPHDELADVIAANTRPAGTHLLWTGRTNNTGTPVWDHRRRTFTATRIAWLVHHRDEPRHRVERTCGNPQCVHPDHLTDRPSLAHRQRRANEQRFNNLLAAVAGSAA